MILADLEQKPLYDAVNFSLPITDPGSMTARTTALSVFLRPNDVGIGAVVVRDASGKVLEVPLARPEFPIGATTRRLCEKARVCRLPGRHLSNVPEFG